VEQDDRMVAPLLQITDLQSFNLNRFFHCEIVHKPSHCYKDHEELQAIGAML
jgi:hypothetical protein